MLVKRFDINSRLSKLIKAGISAFFYLDLWVQNLLPVVKRNRFLTSGFSIYITRLQQLKNCAEKKKQ
jgi:hypothetical protein